MKGPKIGGINQRKSGYIPHRRSELFIFEETSPIQWILMNPARKLNGLDHPFPNEKVTGELDGNWIIWDIGNMG